LEFILYQMKIMLKKKDYVRFFIISKKINENNINDDVIADLKIQYFAYMAIYFNHESKTEQSCRSYRILWETLKITKKIIPETLDFNFSASIRDVLSNYIGYLVLQPYSEATYKELKELSEREEFEKYPEYLHIINNFLSEEIVKCNVTEYNPEYFELFRDSYSKSKVHPFPLRNTWKN
jgi:26S proteasome regulatory subunit N5